MAEPPPSPRDVREACEDATARLVAALPVRLARLDRRRRVGADHPLVGTTWLLRAVDGPAQLVTLGREGTDVRPADGAAPAPDAVVEAPAAALLAPLLLGRPAAVPPVPAGDETRARAFTDVWGGP